jgi:WD40 repeat protein
MSRIIKRLLLLTFIISIKIKQPFYFTKKGHASVVMCLDEFPQMDYLVSGSDDKSIRLWDILAKNKIESLRTFRDHSRSVRCVKVVSENLFASGSDDATIKLWSWSSDECKKTLSGHASAVYCLEIVNNSNQLLISCSLDKTIRVWDLNGIANGSLNEYREVVCVQVLKGHADTVSCIKWQPITARLYSSGSFENVIKVWNLSLGKCVQTIHTSSYVSRIEMCPSVVKD